MAKRGLSIGVMLLLLLGLFAPRTAQGDLDVGMPPGTPLEWDKDFPKPVPTPRGGVPAVTEAYREKQRLDKLPKDERGRAQSSAPPLKEPPKPPQMDFTIQNLYSYFDILTVDIMNHLQVKIPPVTKLTPDKGKDEGNNGPVITGPGGVPLNLGEWELKWRYQPDFPVELVWDGITTCLRTVLHPEIISNAQARAHLIEIGVPAGVGAGIGGGPIAKSVQAAVGVLSNARPDVPGASKPFDKMACRLAAMEFTAGFPKALDPNYARHILALGEEGEAAVIKCTKARHPFLRRNAVSALGSYKSKAARKALRSLINDRDLVVRIRALKGLVGGSDRGTVALFKKLLSGRDAMMRSIGAAALGALGDSANQSALLSVLDSALRAGDADGIWAALPAVARTAAKGNEKVMRRIRQMKKNFLRQFPQAGAGKAGGVVPAPPNPNLPPGVRVQGQVAANPEQVGFKNRIFYEMCMLALAAHGDQNGIQEVEKTLAGGISGFHKSNWYLVIDALTRLGTDKAIELLKKIVDSTPLDVVSVYAINRLSRLRVTSQYFFDKATLGGRPMVRAAALIALSQKSGAMAKDACRKIIDGVTAGTTNGAEAFLIATALQIGGKLAAFDADQVVKLGKQAFDARAFARREGNNDPDITKANVSVFPPLLETAMFEVARTGDAKAIPLLIEVLKARLPAGSAEAALGLGNFRTKKAAQALLDALDYEDGWIRFSAYRALRNISNLDYFVDWIFGTKKTRKSPTEGYRKWFNETFK